MKKLEILLILLSFGCLRAVSMTTTITVTVGKTFEIDPVSMSGLSTAKALSGSASFPNTDGLSISPTSHSVHIVGENKPGWSNSIDGSYTTYSVKALKTGTYVITGSASACKSYGWNMSGTYTSYYIKESESNTFTCTVTVVDVTSVSLPNTITVNIGDTYTFSPIITDSRATTTLNWISSQTKVATISSTGILTATSVGTTTISCTASNGVSAQCIVYVNPLLVDSIILDKSVFEMTIGEERQLTATLFPTNATNKTTTWSSSNDNIALVDENGMVKAIGAGVCQIKAVTNDGSNKMASCTINVKEKSPIVGDVNGDGSVDIGDIVTIIDIMTSGQQ